MAAPALKLPTFDELYARIEGLPQNVTGEILEPGVLHTMSRPGRPHGRAAKMCMDALRGHDIERGGTGWWILVEAEIRLAGSRLVVPDLAGYRVERVPELPNDNPLTIVPDWCCEVLSPGTARDDRTVKLPLYAQSGIGWIWLVDPELRTVEVFKTIEGGLPALAAVARDEDTPTLPPFDSPMGLAGWWLPRPKESPPDPSNP